MHNALKPTVLNEHGDSGVWFLVREHAVEDMVYGLYEVVFHDNIDTRGTRRNCQQKKFFSAESALATGSLTRWTLDTHLILPARY